MSNDTYAGCTWIGWRGCSLKVRSADGKEWEAGQLTANALTMFGPDNVKVWQTQARLRSEDATEISGVVFRQFGGTVPEHAPESWRGRALRTARNAVIHAKTCTEGCACDSSEYESGAGHVLSLSVNCASGRAYMHMLRAGSDPHAIMQATLEARGLGPRAARRGAKRDTYKRTYAAKPADVARAVVPTSTPTSTPATPPQPRWTAGMLIRDTHPDALYPYWRIIQVVDGDKCALVPDTLRNPKYPGQTAPAIGEVVRPDRRLSSSRHMPVGDDPITAAWLAANPPTPEVPVPPKLRIQPTYFGDGVYAHDDGYHLVLTTGHHEPGQADSVICLDPEVRRELRKLLDTFDRQEVPGE